MFEQVKVEPLQFYHSNCQPQFQTAQQILLPHQSQQSLIDNENKNNVSVTKKISKKLKINREIP